ncbi:MarR family winged helix-turn-helix transcriptional regulator [Micromonospora okii]|uniref:MarR family winged helix-turn-helix transcriptional regulator n=1 Tax=Micromonospora okii TaxID=1182970 RepID=UPI001E444285|nr:MarR family winged helix-turn-helix transcriptional regulator [Micromonospora okii]
MSGQPPEMVLLARETILFGALARTARRAVRRQVAAAGLPQAQVEVLRAVQAQPGIGTRAVAQRLQLVPNTVSTLVGGLVAAGLLLRVRDDGDRRATRLHLTEQAVDRLARWDAARDEVLSTALARLDEGDRSAIRGSLPALRRLLAALHEAGGEESDGVSQAAGPQGTTTGQPVTGSRSTLDSTP